MRRFVTAMFVLWFCMLSLGALAQENHVVRVGVAVMKNAASRSVSGSLERDRLVSDLNQMKPDKKTHIAVQGVALDGTSADEVADEAKQKKCDYVVYTSLLELRMSSDPMSMQRTPGTIQTNPNIGAGMPGSSPNSLNQTYQATVEYKLYRADGTAVSGAPFSIQQGMSEEVVVSQLMDRIASKVFGDIRKAGPAVQ
jgi:hypothetical protein